MLEIILSLGNSPSTKGMYGDQFPVQLMKEFPNQPSTHTIAVSSEWQRSPEDTKKRFGSLYD